MMISHPAFVEKRSRFSWKTLFSSVSHLPEGTLSAAALLAAAAALLLFPGETRKSVKASLFTCLNTLVPSLFPFLALTCFAVESSASHVLSRLFREPVRRLFRLPPCCAAPLLMGFLGGYPAGAKGVSLLLEQGKIDRRQAGRMLLFCVCPGPAFTVTFLGIGVFRSLRAGWLLFFSVAVPGLLLGLLTALHAPVPPSRKQQIENFPPGVLLRSVSGASKSVVTMCSCILLFSAFSAILRGTGLFSLACGGLSALLPLSRETVSAFLSLLLEVTAGMEEAARAQAGPALFAFGAAFGGLCVHMQLFSFFPEFPVRKRLFLLFRLLHGLLAAGMAALLVRFLPGDPAALPAAVWAAEAPQSIFSLSGPLTGGLSLLMMCLAFLMITTKEQTN